MGKVNSDHDHVEKQKLDRNLDSIRAETKRRKDVRDTLTNASDKDFEDAQAEVEGRIRK